MTMPTAPAGSPPRRPLLAGTVVERYGWVLVALLSFVLILFGLLAFFSSPGRDTEIVGSGCCNGHRMSEVAPWAYDYLGELARYMASYMLLSGLLMMTVVLVGLRRGAVWAWAVCWLLPALFAVHAFVLGAFPFDAITLAITATGLLLMVRPVFGQPPADTTETSAPARAQSSTESSTVV